MKINKHNYEVWFLDYTEGRLSVGEKQELLLFLEQNPALKKELEEYEAVVLPANDIVFKDKERLKKPVYGDEVLIAYLENGLGKTEKKELEKAIDEHAYLKKEIDLYKKTISIPDDTIIYKHKEKLKKRGLVVIWNNPVNYFRAAAAIILLTGLIVLITSRLNKETESLMAKNKTVPTNVSPSPTPLPKSTLIAVREQQRVVPKKNNISFTKQNSLHKAISTNKTISIANDSMEKNNTSQNTMTQNIAKQDTLSNQPFVASTEGNNQSYFNHTTDANEDNTTALKAKINQTQPKKPFFKFLFAAVKGAKQFGAKHIDVKEEANQSTIMLGGLVLSETTSN